ncbi:MAG: hypothetical protein ACOC13_03700 [Tangfeifania sp.]
MGISACIQRFVDDLDIHSTYYLLLLFFTGLLIVATFYVKQKVYGFRYTVQAPVTQEVKLPHNQVATICETDFVFGQTD